MATYGKPTTSFYINYGTLDPGAAERALAPALIAPRYRLHRIGSGFGETLLGKFDASNSESNTEFYWPHNNPEFIENGTVDGVVGVVDKASAKLQATDIYLKANTKSLTCTWAAANCLKFTNPVQGKNRDDALNDYDIKPGDIIQLPGVLTPVEDLVVVDVLASETPATVVMSKEVTGFTVADAATFKGEEDAWYQCTVNGSKLQINAILGDSYTNTANVVAGGTISVGSYGIVIAVGETPATTGSFIIKATAAKSDTYNRVYIDYGLDEFSGIASADVATPNLAPAVSAISGTYWDFVGDKISVKESMYATVGSKNYEVIKANLHMQYRELLTDDVLELKTSQTTDIANWAGPADPENPMGMMFAAAGSVSGTFFYLLAVGDTEADTIEGINYVGQFESAYALIPYLQTPATQAAVSAVIAKYSDPQIAQFKHAWFCSTTGSEDIVYEYTEADNSPLIGTVAAGVATLEAGADILKARVKAGDYIVVVDAFDTDTNKYTETEYRIKQVTGISTCTLDDAMAVKGLSRVYFKRKLSGSAYAEKLAAEASAINNIRINFVASDVLSFLGFENVNPVYLCAALASTRCALPPHAPMNELAVSGFSAGNKYKWTDTDYETMNAGGVWVVAKDVDGNTVTYHQVTTRTDGTIAEEDSVVSNGDAIVRQLRQAVKPYASGKSNVTGALLDSLRDALNGAVITIQNEVYPPSYGNRILNFGIQNLYIPEGNKRSIVCACRLDLPQPMHDGQFTFNLF